ncbi:MAG: MATE family efflux transporter, partial [Chlorobi bacterium]|nr:MATE family efflux transporter [Chlorobiota bacterium]
MQSIPSYKSIWQISFPIFLSMLAQNIIILVDTVFLGRVGEIELGASAIGGLFYLCLYLIGFGFGVGSQIIIGRRNGESNFRKIGEIFDHSTLFLLLLAVVFFFLTKATYANIMGHILRSPDIFHEVTVYLDIRVWGLLFAYVNVAFRAFYVGITKTKFISYSAAIMALVNIALDYVLIFGHYGFPEMGIKGAALASVIAEGTSVCFFILITLKKVDIRKYSLFRFWPIQWQTIKNILNIAVFIMLQFFISVVSWFSFFLIIEQTGERPIAVSNIVRSLYMILTIPIWGLGATTNTIVSNMMGENRIDGIIPAIFRIAKISFFSILVVIAVTWLFAREMISLYTDNVSLINDALGPLYVVLGVMLVFSISIVIFNGVAGTANTKTSLIIEIVAILIYLTLA